MITTLGLLVGAGLVTVATWVGWLIGRRHPRSTGPVSPLLCSCGHGFGTHDNAQRCHGRDTHRRNGVQEVDPCPCHRYDGPEPLPRVWTPELDSPAAVDHG